MNLLSSSGETSFLYESPAIGFQTSNGPFPFRLHRYRPLRFSTGFFASENGLATGEDAKMQLHLRMLELNTVKSLALGGSRPTATAVPLVR